MSNVRPHMQESRPRSLESEALFPYKGEIIAALAAGARLRKAERRLLAGQLVGTYQIRLHIAQDPKINDAISPAENSVARDLATIVENLSVDPATEISAFSIRNEDGTAYFLFEYEKSGGYVGCLRAERPVGEV